MSENNGEGSAPAAGFGQRAKLLYFLLIHRLLHQCRLTQSTVAVVLLLQCMQLAQFSVSRSEGLFAQLTISGLFQSVMRCTTFSVLYRGNPTLLLVVGCCRTPTIYSDLLIVLVLLSTLLRMLFVISSRRPFNSLDNFLVSIANFLLYIFRTVLLVPTVELLLIGVSTTLQKVKRVLVQAYGIEYDSQFRVALLQVVAAVSATIYLLLTALAMLGMRDSDIFSKVPFHGPLNHNELLLTLLTLVIVLYRLFDYEERGFRAFLVVSAVLYLTFVVRRSYKPSFYSVTTERLSQLLANFLLWFALAKVMQSFTTEWTESTTGLPFFFIALSLVVMLVAIEATKHSLQQRILHQPLILLRSEAEVEQHIIQLVQNLETFEQPESRVQLEGYLGAHLSQCKLGADQCSCGVLRNLKERLSAEESSTQWYQFVLGLLRYSLVKFEGSRSIHLLMAYVLKQRLNNKFSALYNLAKVLERGSSLTFSLLVHHNKECIQYEMVDDDDRHNEKKSVNINKFFEFNNLVVRFEERIARSVNLHIEFWKELTETSIDIGKLEKLGSTIISHKELARQTFDQLSAINPNNCHCLKVYGHFLMNVANEEAQHVKLLDRAETIRQNMLTAKLITDEKRAKYGDNAQTAIFVISGNEHQLGCIQNVNNQVNSLMGWTRKELLGQNLSKVMPKIFGESHDFVLNRYLSTSEERFNCKERTAPAFTRDGYMLPCTAMTKVLPNLERGIEIVGFLCEMKEDDDDSERQYHYLLYRNDTEVVQGISRGCYDVYGVSGVLAYGHPKNTVHELTMRHLFNESPETEEIKQLLRGSGFSFKLDTHNLSSEFPLNYDGTEEESDSQHCLQKKSGSSGYVIAKVKLQMVYNGVPLTLLCFWSDSTRGWKTDDRDNNAAPKVASNQPKSRLSVEHGEVMLMSGLESPDDEFKQLKEFKNFIAAKSEPVSVKIVYYSALSLVVLLFVLSYLSFQFSMQRRQLFTEALKAVDLSQRSAMVVAEQAYYLRKYHLYLTWFSDVEIQRQCRGNLSQLNFYLEHSEFQLEPIYSSVQKESKSASIPISSIDLQPDGGFAFAQAVLETELDIFVGNIYSLLNLDAAYFQFSPYRPVYTPGITFATFLKTIYSALFELVQSRAKQSLQIFQYYNCRLNECSKEFPIVLGTSLGFIIISLCVIIPYVVSVNNINSRVLSLFGIIPPNEIQGLMDKCGKYLEQYLVEAEPVNYELRHLAKFAVQDSCFSPNSPTPGLSSSGAFTPSALNMHCQLSSQARFLSGKQSKSLSKNNLAKDQKKDRTKQFSSSSSTSKLRIVCQYSIVSLLFAAYFLSDYFITIGLLKNVQLGFENKFYVNQRIRQMRQLKTSAIEALIDGKLGITNNRDASGVTAGLIESMYDTERNISNLNTADFSGAYSQIVSKINRGNVCDGVEQYSVDFGMPLISNNLTSAECLSVSEGILQKGLQTVIISRLEQIRADLAAGSTLSQQNKLARLSASYTQAQLHQKYLQYPNLFAVEELVRSLNSKLDTYWYIGLGRLSGFIGLVLVFYVVLWLPYLKDLNMKIWRTKGMLNMIPMQIITQNERLKREFTSGKLEQAVR